MLTNYLAKEVNLFTAWNSASPKHMGCVYVTRIICCLTQEGKKKIYLLLFPLQRTLYLSCANPLASCYCREYLSIQELYHLQMMVFEGGLPCSPQFKLQNERLWVLFLPQPV